MSGELGGPTARILRSHAVAHLPPGADSSGYASLDPQPPGEKKETSTGGRTRARSPKGRAGRARRRARAASPGSVAERPGQHLQHHPDLECSRTGVPLLTPNLEAEPAAPDHPRARRRLEQQQIPVLVPANPFAVQGPGCGAGEGGQAGAEGGKGPSLGANTRLWAFPHPRRAARPRRPGRAPRLPEDVRHGAAHEVQVEVLQHRQPAQLGRRVQAHVEERRGWGRGGGRHPGPGPK